MRPTRLVAVAVAAATLLAAAGCGTDAGDDESSSELVVYSGRSEEQVADLVQRFEAQSGTSVSMRYGDTAELAVTLLEEGDRSPADIFWAQDAGALSAVADEGLFTDLEPAVLGLVPAAYRAADGRWVGTSGRARVFVYDPEQVAARDLPTSVFELADPAWEGKVAIAPTNGSFQAFVTALRLSEGEEVARQWLTDLKANGAQAYESNDLILEAVDSGDIPLGLVNHYYWYQRAAEVGAGQMSSVVGFFAPGDPGSLVNVAGVGILTGAAAKPEAAAFVEFLLAQEAQEYIVDVTKEYPLIDGVKQQPGLPSLADLAGPDVPLYELDDLEGTLVLLTETGWI